MRRIGMLGGMSWESTAEYYRFANQLVRERMGGVHSARLLIDSVDFADIESLQENGDWGAAGEILSARAQALEAAGAELLVLCTNTMHKVADRIEAAVAIPLIHIADATAAAIQDCGFSQVALLGTRFTMEQGFYRDRLAAFGIRTLIPGPGDREVIHRVIYEELVRGVIRDESRAAYTRIIESLQVAGAEAVVLGCTEIELLISDEDSPIPTFPTTQIHICSAIDQAFARDVQPRRQEGSASR